MTDNPHHDSDDHWIPSTMMSRASLLRRGGAVAVALPSMSAILAACGGSSGGGSSAAVGGANPGAGMAIQTPAASGPLARATWALLYEPTSLDWTKSYNYAENTVVSNVTESLYRLMPDFSYQPSLATSYAIAEPTKLVYQIRQGVLFSDGSPMTADDVVYSLRRNLSANSYWSLWSPNIASVDKTGAWEVTVTLKQPDSLVPGLMATPLGGVGSEKYIQAKGSQYGTARGGALGTGPFMFDEWKPGQSITLTKNPHYWDHAHAPKTTTLNFVFISDEGTLVGALLSGSVTGTYGAPYSGIPELQSASNGSLYLGKDLTGVFLSPLSASGPLTDARVRQALLYALDREAIAKVAYNGAATPLKNTVLPLETWSYATAEATTAYNALPGVGVNLSKAKDLFAQAGSPSDQVVVAVEAAPQTWVQVGTIIQAAAQEMGLNLRIETVQPTKFESFFFDPQARQGYDAWVVGLYCDIADPLEYLIETSVPPNRSIATNNLFWPYNNAAVTKAAVNARATYDESKKAQYVLQAQQAMQNDLPHIPLVVPSVGLFMSNVATGAPASFCYLYYPWARDLGAK